METGKSDEIKGAASYALDQIGKHAPKHAGKVAENQVLGLLLYNVKLEPQSDLNKKAKSALQKIIFIVEI